MITIPRPLRRPAADNGLTPLDGFREITWEIGTAELQRSILAAESVELLLAAGGEPRSTVKMRSSIRQRRKLLGREPIKGGWNDSPQNKFVNEHAWAMSELT